MKRGSSDFAEKSLIIIIILVTIGKEKGTTKAPLTCYNLNFFLFYFKCFAIRFSGFAYFFGTVTHDVDG
jgi:hypothetical protein